MTKRIFNTVLMAIFLSLFILNLQANSLLLPEGFAWFSEEDFQLMVFCEDNTYIEVLIIPGIGPSQPIEGTYKIIDEGKISTTYQALGPVEGQDYLGFTEKTITFSYRFLKDRLVISYDDYETSTTFEKINLND